MAHNVDVRDMRGWFVRHTCDNPPCINPLHLVRGTHAENMADMKAKGRAARDGGRPPRALLAWEVSAAHEWLAGARPRHLAAKYGVTARRISKSVELYLARTA